MDVIYTYIREEWVEATGWALLHSLWQGTLVMVLLLAVLFLFKKMSSQVRYLLAYSSLLVCLLWPSFTFYKAWNYAHEKQLIKEKLLENPASLIQLISMDQTTGIEEAGQDQTTMIDTIRLRAFLQRHFPEVFVLWVLGIIIFLFRLSGGMLYLSRLRKRQTLPIDQDWLRLINDYAKKLKLKRKLEVLQSALVKVPVVIGHIKPIILFPVSFFSGLSQQEIEAVIAHELAHIRRYDYLLNIIQSVIEILFFFHPAIWLISKIIRDEREHSCDDIAVRATGDKLTYLKALATTQEILLNNNTTYAVAFTKKHSLIFHRINRIKKINTMKNNISEGFIAATFIFISLLLLSFTIDNQNLKSSDFYSLNKKSNQTSTIVKQRAKTHKPHSVAQKKALRDTVCAKVKKINCTYDSMPDDMKKVVEIALTSDGGYLSQVIIHSIDSALNTIEINKTVQEALHDKDSIIKNIKVDVDVNKSLEQAKLQMEKAKVGIEKAKKEMESHKQEMENSNELMKNVQIMIDSIKPDSIINNAVGQAKVIINDKNIQSIVKMSIDASAQALSNINLDKIIRDAIDNKLDTLLKGMDTTNMHHEIIRIDDDVNKPEKNSSDMEKDLRDLEK